MNRSICIILLDLKSFYETPVGIVFVYDLICIYHSLIVKNYEILIPGIWLNLFMRVSLCFAA